MIINSNIILESHPLPRIEDMLATIGPVKYISRIDLSQAYMQMPLSDESKNVCSLNSQEGRYWMLRLPCGVSSAPFIFQ